MKLKTIKQIKNLKNRRVLVRVDFNCPLKNSCVDDDFRIRLALPTIEYLLKKQAKIILISHFGRPNGRRAQKYSLRPVFNHFKRILNHKSKIINLKFIDDCIGPRVKKAINEMKSGDILLLENLRFHPGEEKNDPKFAKQLANLADIYINEAFSVSHRKHASLSAITKYLSSYAGLLFQKEVKIFSQILQKPKHPFVVVMGGIKISTKIRAMKNLLKIADNILVGGALANNFLKVNGINIGKSVYEPDMIGTAKKLLKNKKIILPIDFKIKFGNKALVIETQELNNFKKEFEILDVGLETIKLFSQYLKITKTIIWSGPLGYFEDKRFSKGTKHIPKEIFSNKKANIIIGGGETISAIKMSDNKGNNNVFISTGGGSMLEFLSGKVLPGIKPLMSR